MKSNRVTLAAVGFVAASVFGFFTPAVSHATLVGLWNFDNQSLAETSGFQPAGTHDGTAIGTVSYSTDTPNGSGFSLNLTAANSSVGINNSASTDAGYKNTYDLTNTLTIAFWVKGFPSTAGNWAGLVEKTDDAGVGYEVRQSSNTTNTSFSLRGTAGADDTTSAFNFTDGKWHMMAAVYDGTAGTRKLYVDGNLDANINLTGDTGPIGNMAAQRLFFGSQGGTQRFAGVLMDNVQIYNTALTQSQVQALVPEPASLGILGLAGLGLLARRRRV